MNIDIDSGGGEAKKQTNDGIYYIMNSNNCSELVIRFRGLILHIVAMEIQDAQLAD